MRNRYKRDVNRLVNHPRQRPASKSLRYPGLLNRVFSSASGLEREQVTEFAGFLFEPALASGEGVDPVKYGEPFSSGGTLINPPLGTANGTSAGWLASPRLGNDPYAIEKGMVLQAGGMTWLGTGSTVLSWEGPGSRIFEWEYAYSSSAYVGWRTRWALGTKVYSKNATVVDMAIQGSNGDDLVLGAAVNAGSLLVVTMSAYQMSPTLALYQFPVSASLSVTGVGQLLATYTPPETDIQVRSGCYFSTSGGAGVCTLRSDNYRRLYALRVTASGFERALVYDANDGLGGESYDDITCDYTVVRDGSNNITSVTWDETVVTTVPALEAPIYLDYRGEVEITVSHVLPASVTTSNSAGTDDTPAGTVDSTRTISTAYQSNEKIVTSQGDTLAELVISRVGTYQLDVTPVSDVNLNSVVSVSRSARGREWLDIGFPSFDVLCINARDGICAVRMDIEDTTGSGTDPNSSPLFENGGPDRYYSVTEYDSTRTVTRRLEVFVDGVMVDGADLGVEVSTTSGLHINQDYWYAPDYVLALTGSGTYTRHDSLGKPNLVVENTYYSPELDQFSGVKHLGRTAVAVLHQDSNGIHRYQNLSGEGDPADTIFGQAPGDPYVMYGLTML